MTSFNPGRRDEWIYFIVNESYSHVKIGKSSSEKGCVERLRSCQTGNHEKLFIASVLPPWNHHGELAIHRRFASDRVRGEWFVLTPDIAAFMQRGNAWRRDPSFVVDEVGDTVGESKGACMTYWCKQLNDDLAKVGAAV